MEHKISRNPPSGIGPSVPLKVLFSIEEAASALSMGRTTLFALIRKGDIAAVKIGTRRLIAASELEAFAIRLQKGE
jgi:excisionase family DNA binding protein